MLELELEDVRRRESVSSSSRFLFGELEGEDGTPARVVWGRLLGQWQPT